MRKALAVVAGVLLLVALYAAAGYWIAPGQIRDALVERAAQQGIDLRIEDIEVDPFQLRLVARGVELHMQDRVLAAAPMASVDLTWASLWQRTWLVETAHLEQPQLNGAVASQLPGGKEGGGDLPAVRVGRISVQDGTVRLPELGYTLASVNVQVQDLSTQSPDSAHYQAAAALDKGGQLSSRGRFSLPALTAQGTIEVTQFAASRLWDALEGTLRAAAAFSLAEGSIKLSDVVIEASGLHYAQVTLPQVRVETAATYGLAEGNFQVSEAVVQASNVQYAHLTLPQLRLETAGLTVPPKEPFKIQGKAEVAPSGQVALQGTVGIQPLQARLDVNLTGLALTQVQPWLPEPVDVRIASGTLSAEGTLRVTPGGEPPQAQYEGTLAVQELRLEERDSGRLLIGWTLAETDQIRIKAAPYGVYADEIKVQAPEGRLIIEQDGSVNFVTAFAGDGKTKQNGAPFEAVIKRLGIEDGTLRFVDRSLENAFDVLIRELAGAVSGFSTESGNPARVRLAGRVQKYGTAAIRGTINLDNPRALADITATFRNLPLTAFNPYVVKFAGYRIESGRVSAELHYEVKNGRLQGVNDLVFEQIQLGEKVQGGALDLPLELAVALLADREGRINLDIPVSGNLNDPQFDLGGLIARAFGNVVRRIVTAPFRAVAALFGKGKNAEDLGVASFEPGAVSLTPPQEQRLAQVAQVLQQRPRLAVTVQGGFDPEQDLQALREAQVRREIAMRAGVKTDGSDALEFDDPQMLEAAERMYLERIGDRLQLQALRQRAEHYGPALVDMLAKTVSANEAELQTLAHARAEAVRAFLAMQGVEPSRIRVGEPVRKPGEKTGIATELSLFAR